MRERSGVLAAFLGMSAVLYHTGSPNQISGSGTKNSAAVVSTAAAEEHSSDWDLLKNLDEFYLLGAPRPASTAVAGKVKVEHGNDVKFDATFAAHEGERGLGDAWWHDKLRDRFDWIVATIPDPELSEMRLDFDREVNSIQNAVESAGYHFDRYWLPWKTDDAGGTNAASEDESNAELGARRNLPGMLLFRARLTGKGKDFIVFLVGETPTSGIVPGQFKNAIRFGEFSKHEDPLRIAGPGFSGSFASLGKLIDKYFPAQRFRVGTWTSDSASQTHFEAERPKVTLAATSDSSLRSIATFCAYVREHWGEKDPIVLLVEESTAFGSGLAGSIAALDKHIGPIYIVKFPRGISKLRNATESKEQIPGFSQGKSADPMRRELPFTLREERAGSSELPYYSKEQSPVSQEAVLFSIASLMKKGALHYAGIVASDTLDLLFLSRFLRSASPNTRLFTGESDLLFQHGSDGSEYQGMLTITNYPLFAFNQIWTRSLKNSTMQIFPSGRSESVYNAVVQLLAKGNGEADLREYADPFEAGFDELKWGEPPLWVTVASGNGYAPVAVVPDGKKDTAMTFLEMAPVNQELRGGKGPQWAPEYWESWGYAFACIWCLCVAYGAVLLCARPTGNRLFAIFSIKACEPRPLRRAYYLCLLGLCLSMLVAMWLAVPYVVMVQNADFLGLHGVRTWQWGVLLQMCSGAGLVFAAGLLVRRKGTESLNVAERGGMALLSLIAVLLAVLAFALHPELREHALGALGYGGIVVASVAAPVSATQLGARTRGARKTATARLSWHRVVPAIAVLVLFLTVFCCWTPSLLQNSPSLLRLWRLLYGGAAVLGAAMASAALPLVDAIQGLKQEARRASRPWVPVLLSDGYFRLTVALAVGGAGLLCWTAIEVNQLNSQQFFAACRSINITSGVCPLTPLTMVMLALMAWCFTHLRRVTYHEDRCPEVPDLPDDVFCPALRKVIDDVKARIAGEFFDSSYNLGAALGVLLAVCFCFACEHETVEGYTMDRVMIALACVVGISLLMICMRFVLIWSTFREFLQQLERHPLREIFNFLPRGFLWAPIWQSGSKKRTHVAVTRSLECVRALVNNRRTSANLTRVLEAKLPRLTGSVKELLGFAAARRRVPAPFYQDLQEQLCLIGNEVAAELGQDKWLHGSYEARSELSNRNLTKDALCVTRGEYEIEEPYTIGSEFLALRFVPFINYVLLQLQNLAMYLSCGFILLVTAMNLYVFRSRTVIDWFLTVFFLLLGGAVATVFSQLDRDAIFSRITRTEEGKLDRNFFLHLISYGGIPTLALLASHVPSVAKFFFSWIKPAMEAIH